MIIITEIKTITFAGNTEDLDLMPEHHLVEIDKSNYPGNSIAHAGVLRELVQGRRYIRPDGTEVIIGNSCEAASTIGIQYEAWEEKERMIEDLQTDLGRARYQIDVLKGKVHYYMNCAETYLEDIRLIRAAGFWTRLKWLIEGVDHWR